MKDLGGDMGPRSLIRNQIEVSETRMRYGIAVLVPILPLSGCVLSFPMKGRTRLFGDLSR